MNMKKIAICLTALLALSSCAKIVSESSNAEQIRVFQSWVSQRFPELYTEDHLGPYVIKDEVVFEGGKDISKCDYVFAYITMKNLDGSVIETQDIELQKQLGTYDKYAFHGANCVKNDSINSTIGSRLVLRPNEWTIVGPEAKNEPLKSGVRRHGLIPGYLQTSQLYGSLEAYSLVAAGSNIQFSILAIDGTNDINKWQIDTMERSKIFKALAGQQRTDSLALGFYFKGRHEREDTTSFKNDTTIYMNYVGRLLDGYVFDSNIKDTAKVHGFYKASNSYAPMKIKYNGEDYKKICTASFTASDKTTSDLISGMCRAIYETEKAKFDSAVCMFDADYAYGTNSSAGKYPAYSPMIFEIQFVPNPNSDN